jgi:hypothetical protein
LLLRSTGRSTPSSLRAYFGTSRRCIAISPKSALLPRGCCVCTRE